MRWGSLSVLAAAVIFFTGCAVIPGSINYKGPPPRPDSIEQYYGYDRTHPYTSVSEQSVTDKDEYNHKRLFVGTSYGQITVEYYQRHEFTPNLVFVFPVLGGDHILEGYFAKYLADHGFDAAIVHRDRDFKRPELFAGLEDIFRYNVIRDRIIIDFFEREYGKKQFGGFGLSRGAMNAAVTAGADARLKYNVLILGGSHLVEVFRNSDVHGIKRYRDRVLEENKITAEQFYTSLENGILTDPKNLARYLDARSTMMVLSVFDNAVPFEYGMSLRKEIGKPKTIFLLAGHYTALLYTQFLKILPPSDTVCIFPFDFIESESLRFYQQSFDTGGFDFWHLPFRILQLPIQLIGYASQLF